MTHTKDDICMFVVSILIIGLVVYMSIITGSIPRINTMVTP